MYFKRNIEPVVRQALATFPVVLVTGARQTGKSTLLTHMLPDANYVSLDDLVARDLAMKDPALFLQSYASPLIIDEIQYAPQLLSEIKLRVDKNRRSYGQYILTGSQMFQLMKGVSETLAGRIAIFHLYPLSWSELSYPDAYPLEQILYRGFFPEFHINPDLHPKLWFSAYVSTYTEKDIRAIRLIQDLLQFQKFMTLLAARVGGLFNLTEIGKEVGISQTTAKDWLTLLQSTGVIYLLEPYFRNITKQIIKSPKVFFADTGLLCYLLRIDQSDQLLLSPFGGHIFENMVVMEAIKFFANRGERPPCYFYRSKTGAEVDLIVDKGTYLDAYEIKCTMSPTKEMGNGLTDIANQATVRTQKLLTLRKEPLHLTSTIETIHWSKLPLVL